MAVDYPKTRMDNFFAKAAGSELADDSMEPITDREYWINEMATKINSGGGGGGGAQPLICASVEGVFDKTFGEIYDSFMAGTPVIFHGNKLEEDDRYGYWGLLKELMIQGNIEESVYGELNFEGGYATTDAALTIDALMELYPYFGD